MMHGCVGRAALMLSQTGDRYKDMGYVSMLVDGFVRGFSRNVEDMVLTLRGLRSSPS